MTTDVQDTPAAPPPAEPDTREKALQELAAEAQAWGFYDPPGAPSSAPAQEGEALRTALKRIVSRIDLEERIKTLGVDCGQKRLHRLYRMPSIRTMAEEALRAATPPVPVAPMGLTERPVCWWNGFAFKSQYTEDDTMPSTWYRENTHHDIPLYAGANPHSEMAKDARRYQHGPSADPRSRQQETGHE